MAIVLDGSAGITTPDLTDSSLTSGRVVYAGTSGNLTGSSSFVFDGTNLGIGTSSPSAKLTVLDATRASVFVQDSDGRRLRLQSPDSAANPGTIGTSTNHDLVIEAGSSGAGLNIMRFNVGGTERARIDTSGNLLVGQTSANFSNNGIVLYSPSDTFGSRANITNASEVCLNLNRRSTDGSIAVFYKDTSAVGSISVTATGTTYNIISDYRLKNNQVALTGSGLFIDALRPKTWAWAQDGSKGVGFIAHEFAEVSPSSVLGEKDAVDAEGKPVYQSMQASSAEVIANLVAEIQSLRTRLTALENK
jgi:hypothetical protein